MTDVNWENAVNGDWSTQADWSNDAIPGSTSDVTIAAAGAYEVTVDSPESAHSITLNDASGTLAVSATLALTTTLAVESGTLDLLSGAIIQGGTIDNTGGDVQGMGGVLQGVTFQGTLDLSSTAYNPLLYIAGGITLAGANGSGAATINVTGATSQFVVENSATLNNATIYLGNASSTDYLYNYDVSGSDSVLTLGSSLNLVVEGSGELANFFADPGDEIVNKGSISIIDGGQLAFNGDTTLSSSGSITVSDGNLLISSGTLINTGSISVGSTGQLYIDYGTLTNTGSISVATNGEFYTDGGTLFNTGHTLLLSGGELDLDSGAIVGGTVQDTSGTLLAAGGLLDAVTWRGVLALTGSYTYFDVEGGLTVETSTGGNPGSIDLTGAVYSGISVLDSETLNNATLNFGASTDNSLSSGTGNDSGNTLTLGGGFTVDVGSGGSDFLGYQDWSVYIDDAGDKLSNAGHINVIDGDLTVAYGTFVNSGSIDVDESTLNIESSTLTNTGSINLNNGGVLEISGVLENAGETLAVSGTGSALDLTGTMVGGTLQIASGDSIYGGGTLDGVTVRGVLLDAGANPPLYVEGGLTLETTTGTKPGSIDLSAPYYADISVLDSETLNNATLNFGSGNNNSLSSGASSVDSGNTLTLGSAFTVDVGSGGNAYLGYQDWYVYIDDTGDTLDNAGHINIIGGDLTVLYGTFVNSGSINVNDSTLNIASSTLTNTGSINVNNGGVLEISGALDNTGQTISLSGTGASLDLTGTIIGGTVRLTNGASIYGSGTLDGVAVLGTLTFAAAYAEILYVEGGLTLETVTGGQPGSIDLSAATNGVISVLNSETLDNATLNFDGANQAALLSGTGSDSGNTLTLGSGFTVDVSSTDDYLGYSPYYGYNDAGDTLDNAGVFNVDSSSELTIAYGTFVNSGSINVDDSQLNIQSSTLTNTGTINVTDGGVLEISGALDNTGQTLVLSGGDFDLTGTLIGGTVQNVGGATISGGGTLDGVTYEGVLTFAAAYAEILYVEGGLTLETVTGGQPGSIDLSAATYLVISVLNSETLDNATLNFDGANQAALLSGTGSDSGNTLTLGSGFTVDVSSTDDYLGYSPYYGYNDAGDTLDNAGVMNISGGVLTIDYGTFNNSGSINVDGGVLNLSSGTLVNTGIITLSDGGELEISGVLVNTGRTLSIGVGTGLGTVLLAGEIEGGTVNDGGSGLVAQSGTLDGVTYQGVLALAGNDQILYVEGGLTLETATGGQPGSIDLSQAYNSVLSVLDSETLNNATLNFGSEYYNDTLTSGANGVDSGNTLTLGSGFTIDVSGASDFLGYSDWYIYIDDAGDTLINAGQINVSAGILYVDYGTFTNTGSINVDGGVLNIQPGTTFTNTGSISVTDGGVFDLQGTATTAGLGNINAAGEPGLVGYWTGNGNANDTSGLDNNGSFSGSYAPGDGGEAFDLSTGDVTIPASSTYPSGSNFTIGFWFNFNGYSPGSWDILGQDEGPGGDPKWFIDYNYLTGSGFELLLGPSLVLLPSDPVSVSSGWNQLTLVHEGADYTFYLNGTVIGSDAYAGTFPQVNAPLQFGISDGGSPFPGLLQDVAIYDAALTPTQVQGLADNPVVTSAEAGAIGGSVEISGLLVNSGATLDIGNGTSLGTVLLSGGTIQGGTINDAGFGLDASGEALLDGVTYQGVLALAGNYQLLFVNDGLSLETAAGTNPGSIDLSAAAYSGIVVLNNETLDNATLNFGAGVYDSLDSGTVAGGNANDSGNTLTLGSDFTIDVSGGNDLLGDQSWVYNINDSGDTLGDAGLIDINGGGLDDYYATFDNSGSINITGNGEFYVATNSTVFSNTGTISVTDDSELFISSTATFSNTGTITADDANSELYISSTVAFSNTGTITVSDGSELYIASPTLANIGSISVGDGSVLDLAGTLTTAQLDSIGIVAGSTVEISGLLENSGATLDTGTGTTLGTLLLTGGTIQGGTINDAGGGLDATGVALLDGVTYQGVLALAGNYQLLFVNDGLSLETAAGTNPGSIDLSAAAYSGIVVLNNETLDNATLNFGAGVDDSLDSGTVTGSNGNDSGNTLTLGSDFTIDVSGGNDLLGDQSWVYNINDSGDTLSNAGLIDINGGGLYDYYATFDNSGSINVTGSGELYITTNSTGFSNTGIITVTDDGELYISNGSTFSNTGSITVSDGGVLDLQGTETTAQLIGLGVNVSDGGTVEISGLLINTGSTLYVGAGSALGTVDLTGTIQGGTINDAGSGLISQNGTLIGVTYQGTLDLSSTSYEPSLSIAHGITLTGANGTGPGTVNLTGLSDDLYVLNTTTLNNATINIGNSTYYDTLYDYDPSGAGDVLTLGSQLDMVQTGYAELTSSGNADDAIINRGTIDAGTPGLSNTPFVINSYTFTNDGSIDVANFGTLDLQPTKFTNLSGSTLTGGTYEVDANSLIELNQNSSIATDAATIILSGIGSTLESYETTPAKEVTLDQSLTTISKSDELSLLNGRNFTASHNITDNGLLNLGGVVFKTTTLTISSTGTAAGYGTITATIANSGLVQATGGLLQLGSAVTSTGSLAIAAGAELELKGTTAETVTFAAGTLSGGTLVGGTLKIDTASNYTGTIVGFAPADTIDVGNKIINSASIVGNTLIANINGGGTQTYAVSGNFSTDILKVTGDGGSGTDLILYRLAQASTVAPNPVNFGEVHLNSAPSQALSITNTPPADFYTENLDASIGAATGSITVSGSFTALAAQATDSTHLLVDLVTTQDGVQSGGATITLDSDGTLVDGNGLTPLASQTITATGTVYNYATASAAAPNPVSFGEHHVGDTLTQALSVTNLGTADGYTENLDASIGSATGSAYASGAFSELGAGLTNSSSLVVGLNSGLAGVQSGTATIALTSDGSTIDTLGTTALTSQTITAEGTLYNYATASAAAPNPVQFGERHVGDTLSQALSITNLGTADGYTENLDASIGGATGSAYASGAFSELGAGIGNSTSLVVGLNSGLAGVQSGTATITLVSDGSTIDTLGTTALTSQTITAEGTLYNYATASAASPDPVNFGERHVGDTLSQALSVSNLGTADGYTENLDASIGGATGSAYASGAFSELGAGIGNSTSLVVGLNSGLAGVQSGTATITLVSDGSTIDTLGTTALASQTITAEGTLYNYATASAASPNPVNFGEHHVGDTLSRALSISNLGTVDGYTENLDASIGGATGSAYASGAFNELGAGLGNSTSLVVGLNSGLAGVQSGTATITLVSDGSTIDTLGTTALASQTITAVGTLYNYATASAASPDPVNFGERHVGDTLSQALSITNLGTADGYTENLDASIGSATGSAYASGAFSELDAGLGNSTSLVVGLNSGLAGVQSGTATITLTSDGSTIDTLGTTALASQTITAVGTLYNYATASAASPNPVNFGERHVGDTLSQALSITNLGTADGYTENLDASIGGATGSAYASGAFSELGAGIGNSTSLVVGLNSGLAGVQSGTATITLVSDGSTIDTLGTTALASQTITAEGTLYNYATASAASPNPVNFGERHVGDTLSQALSITNLGTADGYTENLDASIGSATGSAYASGAFSELDAGLGNSTSLVVGLNSGLAGVQSGTATITLTSDGSTIDTLGTTALASQTITAVGTLYNYATASAASPNPVNFGERHVGDTLSQALSITNLGTADGYTENLDASIGGATGSAYASGAFSELGAGIGNSTSLVVGLNSGLAGVQSGTATITLVSDGSTIDTLGTTALASQTITAEGTLYNYATASAASPNPVNFGERHVGDTLSQALSITNLGTADGYTENLDASIGSATGSAYASGAFSELGAGIGNSTSLVVGLNSGLAGVQSGTATITLTSDGSTIDTLGTTALASQTITAEGTLYSYATASAASPNPVNFGERHVGDTLSQALSITNLGTADGYTENLDASIGSATGSAYASGAFSELGAGIGNSTSLVVGLNSGLAGVQSGTATIALTSDGSTIDTLGTTALASQTITAEGTLYNYATASAASPNPVNFGEHHVGDTLSRALSISNLGTVDGYTENLDASIGGATGSAYASGAFSELGAGLGNSTSLVVGLNSGLAGVQSGAATITLTSDGSTIDTLGTTALASQTITAVGTLYNYATASAASPDPVNFGERHVGDTLSQALSVSNLGTADGYTENLDASIGGATGSAYASGAFSELGAGIGNSTSLVVGLNSGLAGVQSGTATITLTSDGSTIDTLGTTALASQTITAEGTLYNYATASAASPDPVNFGIVHVGTSVSELLSITNLGNADGFTENLDAGFVSVVGAITAVGSVSELVASATNSSQLSIGLDTSTAGTIDGTASLGLVSDGTGIDSLGTTVLSTQTIAVIGTVDNYATAGINEISGGSTLTQSGTNYTLDLGTLTASSLPVVIDLGISNTATGPADLLSGSLSVVNSSGAFINNGDAAFAGLAAGQADIAPTISLTAAADGTFTETITLNSYGTNASGYYGTLTPETLTITGSVTPVIVLTPGSGIINGANNVTIEAAGGVLRASQQINGGGGINTLELEGGGIFDLSAPSVLENIQVLDATEGQGSAEPFIFLRNGLDLTLNLESAATNPQSAGAVVHGATNDDIINLGSGDDTVYVGNGETINGGTGLDWFYITAATTGETIAGDSSGTNDLYVQGGGTVVMGGSIINMNAVFLENAGTSYNFTANDTPDLVIHASADSDTITVGDPSQSVLGSSGNLDVLATAANAGVAIRSGSGSNTLEITTGGMVALNSDLSNITVELDAATTLALPTNTSVVIDGIAGNDVFVATNGVLRAGQNITGGGSNNTLVAQGGGVFRLDEPTTLSNIQVLDATEGQGSAEPFIFLRNGLDLTLNLESAATNPQSAGAVVHGATNDDIINLGSGNDTVYVGNGETINGGTGLDWFYITAATTGETIAGDSSGTNDLYVQGGGTVAMGGSITNMNAVFLENAGTSYNFTANDTPDLVIHASADSDTITVGDPSQSVLGSSGNLDVLATAANAGVAIRSGSGSNTLEITTGGMVALNSDLSNITVELDAATTLALPTNTSVVIDGIAGNDVFVATNGVLRAGQNITGGGSNNTLVAQGGGVFRLDEPTTLSNIQVLDATEGQGSAEPFIFLRNGLDLTLNLESAATNPQSAGAVVHGATNDDIINLGSGNDTVYVGNGETINGGTGLDWFYITAATTGETIAGDSSGTNDLYVQGGGTVAMGGSITNMNAVFLENAGTSYNFTANDTPDLVIHASADSDTITVGDPSQSVLGSTGTLRVLASAAEAGVAVEGVSSAATTLEITTGGSITLNGADRNVTVQLDAASTLLLPTHLTVGIDAVASGSTLVATNGLLSAGDQIVGSSSGVTTLALVGDGVFNLAAPAELSNIQVVDVTEGQAAGGLPEPTVDLRSGTALTVNVASDPSINPSNSALPGVLINGANNDDVIYLGSGNDLVYLGGIGETVVGGSGTDKYAVMAATIGATIEGGSGSNVLAVQGGGSLAMGSNITGINSVVLANAGTSYNFTANATSNMTIYASTDNDTITVGSASQTVIGSTGNLLVLATAADAGAAVEGVTGGTATTLEITTSGTLALNSADRYLTVQVNAANTTLTLDHFEFIHAEGTGGNDVIIADSAGQVLTGGGANDTLEDAGHYGVTFQDTVAGFAGDTLADFTKVDTIDITNLTGVTSAPVYTGNATSGTLAVIGSGGTVDISMTNLKTGGVFSAVSDGHGGTLISYS